MKTKEIIIENLKCKGCVSTIKKGILKFEEVQNVDIDIEKSIVKIMFNGEEENNNKYKKKLLAMGYPQVGNNNTISVAKSFVSCAIGRVSK